MLENRIIIARHEKYSKKLLKYKENISPDGFDKT
jgi:hypothetical protein